MTPDEVEANQPVWFCPQQIGYGYLYGVDEGISATVCYRTPVRVVIEFAPKQEPKNKIRVAVSPWNLRKRVDHGEPGR